MSESVKIVVEAQTAEAAAALQAFVNQTDAGLKQLSSNAQAAAVGFTEMRESAMLLREGFAPLEMGIYLLGGQRFPQLAASVLGARAAIMATRTAMKLFELSFSEILLPLLAVASAVSAGFVIWDTMGADMESAADKAKKLAEALEKIPRLLEEIADTQKRGIISGDQQAKYQSYLSGATPLYVAPGGAGTTDKKTGELKDVDLTESSVFAPQTRSRRVAPMQLQRANIPQITTWIEQQNENTRLANAPTIAAEDVADQQKKASDEQLRLQEEAARKALLAQRQFAQEGNAVKKEYGAEWAEANKQIDDDINLEAAQSGQKREALYVQEYTSRATTALKFFVEGKISEQEYSDTIKEEQAKLYEGQNSYNESLQRTIELKGQISRDEIEAKLRGIEGNPDLSKQQKADQSVPLQQDMMAKNAAEIEFLQHQFQETTNLNAQLEIQKQINALIVQQAELQGKINTTQNADTFNGTLQERINQLQQVTSVGAAAGQVLVGALDTGFQSMEANLTKVIEGTETWRQALLNVGQAIETEVIQSVLKLIGNLLEAEVLEIIVKGLSWGAFAEGGRPTPGELALVGERGPELWVPDRSGTIIPAHLTEGLLTGAGARPVDAGGPGDAGKRDVHFHFYDSRPHPRDYLATGEGEHQVIDISQRNKGQIGIPS